MDKNKGQSMLVEDELESMEDINPEKSSTEALTPKKVACARCQSRFENFEDLTKHFCTAHGLNPSPKPKIFKEKQKSEKKVTNNESLRQFSLRTQNSSFNSPDIERNLVPITSQIRNSSTDDEIVLKVS